MSPPLVGDIHGEVYFSSPCGQRLMIFLSRLRASGAIRPTDDTATVVFPEGTKELREVLDDPSLSKENKVIEFMRIYQESGRRLKELKELPKDD
jgi:hypothetical protein